MSRSIRPFARRRVYSPGDDRGPSADTPDTHTLSEDGVWHAPGGRDAQDNCASCHGIEEAGSNPVSCIDCHSAASIASGEFDDEDGEDEDDD